VKLPGKGVYDACTAAHMYPCQILVAERTNAGASSDQTILHECPPIPSLQASDMMSSDLSLQFLVLLTLVRI